MKKSLNQITIITKIANFVITMHITYAAFMESMTEVNLFVE